MRTVPDRYSYIFPRQVEAFTLRYIDNLTLREVGEKIGRLDGTGPLGKHGAFLLVRKAARVLSHHSRKNHPLHEKAHEVIWGVEQTRMAKERRGPY